MTGSRYLPAIPPPTRVSPLSPVVAGHTLTPLGTWRHAREVQRYAREAAIRLDHARIDAAVLVQAAREGFEAEADLLDEMQARAGNNTAMHYLAASTSAEVHHRIIERLNRVVP